MFVEFGTPFPLLSSNDYALVSGRQQKTLNCGIKFITDCRKSDLTKKQMGDQVSRGILPTRFPNEDNRFNFGKRTLAMRRNKSSRPCQAILSVSSRDNVVAALPSTFVGTTRIPRHLYQGTCLATLAGIQETCPRPRRPRMRAILLRPTAVWMLAF